jgi:hypothetical protein
MNREDFRTLLDHKLLALDQESYGDFEYDEDNLNAYLKLSALRAFPAVYKVVALESPTLVSYGSNGLRYVTVEFPERVFLVEDALELTPVRGWESSPTGRVQNLDLETETNVNVYYYDAFEMPENDVDEVPLSPMYTPLILMGALVEALESRHDTGFREDSDIERNVGQHQEIPLLQVIKARYDEMKVELAMALPAVVI